MTHFFASLLGPILDVFYNFMNIVFSPANAYAFSIILFTIFVKTILLPLAIKQQKSMVGMQKIQPEANKLQEKAKKATTPEEKEAVNKEMMALYKKHNVNPAMGCLPLLLQFPIFLGLYKVFASTSLYTHIPREAIEGQFLWLHKLSVYTTGGNVSALAAAKDPYYIIPVLVGITMFISSKLIQKMSNTPNTGAQANQTMAMMNTMNYMFPVMFFFTTAVSPAALGIYFLVSNIYSIFQSYVVNKIVQKHA